MKRFHTHIGSRDAALQQRPEVLKAVSMHATVYILAGVVNYLMRIFSCETFIGLEGIGVEGSASSDMPAYLFLQHSLRRLGTTDARIVPPRSKIPTTAVLFFVPVPVIRRLRSLTCMFRALPPMKVSSTSTSPPLVPSLEPKNSSCIARRIRCSMNHADFWLTLMSRAIS